MSRLTHAGHVNLSTISELFNCAASSSSLYVIAAFGSNTLGLCPVKLNCLRPSCVLSLSAPAPL